MFKEQIKEDLFKASNAVILDEDNGGKGRLFQSRFLQAGLVKYHFGVCLLENEVINKFVYNFVGCPVIIDHKEVTDKSAKEDRVGVISRVWFNEYDGWFYCEGVIFDDDAISLIKDKNYNVSCQYTITDFTENEAKALHNGNDYDKTILNGKPEHLAIVKNPRYEQAMIAVNKIDSDNIERWITTENGIKLPILKGRTFKESVKEFSIKAKDNKSKKDKKKNEAFKILAEATGKSETYVKQNFNSEKFKKLIDEAKTNDNLSGKIEGFEYFSKTTNGEWETNTQEELISQAIDILEGRKSDQSNEDIEKKYEEYEKELAKHYEKLEKEKKKKYNEIIKKHRGKVDLSEAEQELAKLHDKKSIDDFTDDDVEMLAKFYSDIYSEEENKASNSIELEEIKELLKVFIAQNEKKN